MQIIYDPAAKSGARYSIHYESGRQVAGLSLGIVNSELRKLGLSVRDCESRIAEAKLSALATA